MEDSVGKEEDDAAVGGRQHDTLAEPGRELELAAVPLPPLLVEVAEDREAPPARRACIVEVERKAAAVPLVALQLDRHAVRVQLQLREAARRRLRQLELAEGGDEVRRCRLHRRVLQLRLEDVWLREDARRGRVGRLEAEAVLPQLARSTQP